MACPEIHKLLELVDGKAAVEVERHLAACEKCSAAVQWYTATRSAARTDRAPELPPLLAERTLAAIRDAREAARLRGISGFVALIRGILATDSYSPSAAFARGDEDSRQLLYLASPFDVDLLIAESAEPERLRIDGQVLGGDESFEEVTHLRVELVRGGEVAVTVHTSDVGEFAVEGVDPGHYDIRILGERKQILLAEVPVELD